MPGPINETPCPRCKEPVVFCPDRTDFRAIPNGDTFETTANCPCDERSFNIKMMRVGALNFDVVVERPKTEPTVHQIAVREPDCEIEETVFVPPIEKKTKLKVMKVEQKSMF